MICVSAIYENVPGSRFDGDYYTGRHAALGRELLGAHGLQALRISLGLAALDGGPAPYHAISEMIFTDRAAFDAAMAACGEALFADAANYTDVTPTLQLSSWADSSGDE